MSTHQTSKHLAAILVLLLACSALTLAAQKKGARAALFSQDQGKFSIQLDGHTVGHEDFEISPTGAGWAARGTSDLKPPDSPSARVTGTLTLQPDGAPISYEWTAHTGKTNGAQVLFANGTAKITLEMQGARPCSATEIADAQRKQPCFFEQDLSFGTPLIAVLDNNLYHQYAVVARIYDWSKRGVQTLPVLIPQELTPGSINLEATGPVTAAGKSYDGLRVTTADLEVQLFLDSNHRLMRLEVPAAKVSVIRD
jgi:hypothetical protein